jgi:hypothetical protein
MNNKSPFQIIVISLCAWFFSFSMALAAESTARIRVCGETTNGGEECVNDMKAAKVKSDGLFGISRIPRDGKAIALKQYWNGELATDVQSLNDGKLLISHFPVSNKTVKTVTFSVTGPSGKELARRTFKVKRLNAYFYVQEIAPLAVGAAESAPEESAPVVAAPEKEVAPSRLQEESVSSPHTKEKPVEKKVTQSGESPGFDLTTAQLGVLGVQSSGWTETGIISYNPEYKFNSHFSFGADFGLSVFKLYGATDFAVFQYLATESYQIDEHWGLRAKEGAQTWNCSACGTKLAVGPEVFYEFSSHSWVDGIWVSYLTVSQSPRANEFGLGLNFKF